MKETVFEWGGLKWRGWVESVGAQGIDIIDFYFGGTTTRTWRNLTDGERGFILRELFHDAVNVGVIKLPAPIDVKDFSFELQRGNPPSQWGGLVVEYAPPGAKKITGATIWVDDNLDYVIDTPYGLFMDFRRVIRNAAGWDWDTDK